MKVFFFYGILRRSNGQVFILWFIVRLNLVHQSINQISKVISAFSRMSAAYSSSSSSSSSAPVNFQMGSKMGILVSEKQRGNPLLRFLRLIPWQFSADVVPDYIMGSTCAIFLSIKYHLLHPKYVERRITEVGRNFRLRVLLVYVDDLNSTKALFDLNKICFMSDFTIILAWSNEECARYIETFKNYEDKPSTSIQVSYVL